MHNLYDIQAPKRSANLSVNEDLLSKARANNINLSATLEQALTLALQEKQRTQWLGKTRLPSRPTMSMWNSTVSSVTDSGVSDAPIYGL